MAKRPIPKSSTVAVLNKTNPAKLTAAQKSRVAQLIGNAATRHLLDDRFLSPAQKQTRATNVQMAQPVVPGSDVTNRDLARQTHSAAALKYGGAETQAGRDIASRQAAVGVTGGYFDQYLAELRAHEANQAAINAQSQAATQGLAGSVQGLGQQAGQVVQQGNQSLQAATGQAPASITQDASNASMLRQALTASFGAMLAGQGANASGYADTLAHVVGPGQKLQGLQRAQGDVTKAQQSRTDLAKEKGAFEQSFEDQFKQAESKNVLAANIAGVKSTQEQQKIDIAAGLAKGTAAKTKAQTAKTKADTAKSRADTAKSKADKAFFDQHGYYPQHGKPKPAAAPTGYKPGGPGLNKYGYTYDEWNALSPAAREKKRAGGPGGGKPADPATQAGKDFYAKYGIKPVATAAVNKARSDIQRARSWLRQLGGPSGANGQVLSNGQAAGKNPDGSPRPAVPKIDPLLVRVAMDLQQLGGISASTANRLHHAGYSAKTLGLKPAPKAPASAGQLVPGIGGR